VNVVRGSMRLPKQKRRDWKKRGRGGVSDGRRLTGGRIISKIRETPQVKEGMRVLYEGKKG